MFAEQVLGNLDSDAAEAAGDQIHSVILERRSLRRLGGQLHFLETRNQPAAPTIGDFAVPRNLMQFASDDGAAVLQRSAVKVEMTAVQPSDLLWHGSNQ